MSKQLTGHAEQQSPSDGDLLAAFVTNRDPNAFSTLLERYGPMVMGVCRRILRNTADSEDAFQAAFLVLAMKAMSVRPENLGTWLYQVAARTSLKLKSGKKRRAINLRRFMQLFPPKPSELEEDFATHVIDEQIASLPEKYRTVSVLCFVRGMSKREAAAELNVPEGTVSSRLSYARQLLRRRLSKQGFNISPVVLAEVLNQHLSPVPVPAGLGASTLTNSSKVVAGKAMASVVPSKILELAKGVSKTMFYAPLKIAFAAVLVSGALAVPAVAHFQKAGGSQPAKTPPYERRDVIACLADMRQLSNGIILYANAHKGKLPPDLANVLPYLGRGQSTPAEVTELALLFVCPQDRSSLKMPRTVDAKWIADHTSYVYLGTPDMVYTRIPGNKAIILREKKSGAHDGTSVAGFLDGHAALFSEADLAAKLAESDKLLEASRHEK